MGKCQSFNCKHRQNVFHDFPPSQNFNDQHHFKLNLNGMPLKRVTSTKFLGIIIDEKLDWSLHINELCQVLRKNTGILYKLSQFIPQKFLKILYSSLIHSKLLYGILLYANTFPTYLHDLIILNNRILRIIQNKSRHDHTEDLYKTFHTLPIDLLFKSQLYSHANCLF